VFYHTRPHLPIPIIFHPPLCFRKQESVVGFPRQNQPFPSTPYFGGGATNALVFPIGMGCRNRIDRLLKQSGPSSPPPPMVHPRKTPALGRHGILLRALPD
jgi:hypothetical protein